MGVSDESKDLDLDSTIISEMETLRNEPGLEDLIYAVKESLDNEKHLQANIIHQLVRLENAGENLEGLFESLSEKLNCVRVTDFGKTICTTNVCSESIVVFYLKYLLLPKVRNLFS